MKKLLLLTFLILTLFLFACSPQAEDDYNLPGEEETADYGEMPSEIFEEAYTEYFEPALDYEMVEIEGVMRRIMPPGSLTIEHFLEDLDYMVYVLENNFALLNVAYWAHGIDYMELAGNARQHILAMEYPCEDAFRAKVVYSFMPLFYTGHFNILGHISFWRELRDNYWNRRHVGMMKFELMQSPLAQRFYEPDVQQRQYRIDRNNAEHQRLTEKYGPTLNRFFAEGAFSQPLTMEIIEEGRVAYLSTGVHMSDIGRYRHRIFSFYGEITDFEHLIIDLRDNAGGLIDYFLDFILRPHLNEAIDSPEAFIFFMDGSYNRRFNDFLFESTIGHGLVLTEPHRMAHEVVEEYYLPEINHADIERMHFGSPAVRRVSGITPNTRQFGNEPAFGGKIWVLTGPTMGSASQLAAWYAKETGFATLVGDITGGNYGGDRILALMPNTGIAFRFDSLYITDSRGRPLEAGTIPHYFNRPGMDALETVLELIAEGGY